MRLLSTAFCALLLFAAVALGQSSSGVTGIVTDQGGAIVPGVTVTLRDTKTGNEQTTVTNVDGSYAFNSLEAGAGYKLTFSRQGFQTYVVNDFKVSIGRTDTQNVALTAGEVSAVVEVVATSGDATLNTTDARIGNVIGSRQLRELPIQIRGTPAALLGLQPGVLGTNLGTANTNIVGSVTGSRADQGNITVDGIDANDQATGQAFNTVANAPIDSIQEFRGTVAGFGASDGRSSGGQIQIRTNSGTNEYHGNIREYYRTEKLAANSFFSNRNNVARPKLDRHQFGGSIGGPLPYPNFGENGGPLFRSGKDELFFFFDNERRRDRSQTAVTRVVPLATFRDGNIGYVNNGAGCTSGARANNPATAGCISYLAPAQIQALDPRGAGINTALLDLYNSRFPLPNDLTLGDGVNTGGYRFNARNNRDDEIYTLRFDAVPTDRQRIFFRNTITHRDSTNTVQFMPEDDDAVLLSDRGYGWVVGHTWIITPNLSNAATVGVTKSQLYFSPPGDQPQFPNQYAGGTLGSPWASMSYQDREVSTPTYRDDLTWTTGSHTFFFGGSYKPIRQKSTLILDFNFVALGLGGNLASLGPASNLTFRPANILNNNTVRTRYDTAFTTLLGRIATITTNYNYDPSGQVLPLGTGKNRNYAYNETEFYVQDNWRIRSDLTLNLGVRYALYPAPYETEGRLANDSTDWRALMAIRNANAAAGISGDAAEPFLVYDLAGKTNDAPPLYETDTNNWAPRIGFAWNPSFKDGALSALFGERKTSIRGSWGMTYDRVSGAILFIQNQSDYLFQNSDARTFGQTSITASLLNDPRFNGVNALPAGSGTTPPVITRPFTPFVTGGVPNGAANGTTNYTVDHNFKTPISYMFDFGFQRELPGNHIIDVAYVGRLGRDLFTQSDVAQMTNFRDNASGTFLFPAYNSLQAQLQAGGAITAIPWFENQVGAAAAANYGMTCGQVANAFLGLPAATNCTQLTATLVGNLIQIGDASDATQAMNGNGLLFNNVGLSGQFATNAYVTNQGTSDYHGMLVSFQKRFSRGFEYELNYTFSKSLDNNSSVANTVFGGLVCDVNDPDICRGPSQFDVRHIFNANFILDLPFGRNRAFGGNMNRWLDGIVGGWTVSGIMSARSGLPFAPAVSAAAGSYPISFVNPSAGIITDPGAFAVDIRDVNGVPQFFVDSAAADAALRDPRNGEMVRGNFLRGPMYWNLDMGLSKRFGLPWSEKQRLTFRVDAFNVFNTNIFGLPNVTNQSGSFGQITTSANLPRELQVALRWDF